MSIGQWGKLLSIRLSKLSCKMNDIKAIEIFLNTTCNLKWTARGLSPIKLVQTNHKIIKNDSAKQIWKSQYPPESTVVFFITFRSTMSVMLACAECSIEQINSFYFPTSSLFCTRPWRDDTIFLSLYYNLAQGLLRKYPRRRGGSSRYVSNQMQSTWHTISAFTSNFQFHQYCSYA